MGRNDTGGYGMRLAWGMAAPPGVPSPPCPERLASTYGWARTLSKFRYYALRLTFSSSCYTLRMFRVRWQSLSASLPPAPLTHEVFFRNRANAAAFLARKVAALSELALDRILPVRLDEIELEDEIVAPSGGQQSKVIRGAFRPLGEEP